MAAGSTGGRPPDPAPAGRLLERLRRAGKTLAVAESCTGGLICALLTEVPGSSDVLAGGIVAYHNLVKVRILGVGAETLERHGAVSAPAAAEMAAGAARLLGADCGLAATGIAGPGGGTPDKPVGLVFIAADLPDPGASGGRRSKVRRLDLSGGRDRIRRETARAALELLEGLLAEPGR